MNFEVCWICVWKTSRKSSRKHFFHLNFARNQWLLHFTNFSFLALQFYLCEKNLINLWHAAALWLDLFFCTKIQEKLTRKIIRTWCTTRRKLNRFLVWNKTGWELAREVCVCRWKRNSCSNDFCDFFQCDRVGVARGEISLSRSVMVAPSATTEIKKSFQCERESEQKGIFHFNGAESIFPWAQQLICSLPLKGVLEFSTWNANMCSLFIVKESNTYFLKFLLSLI